MKSIYPFALALIALATLSCNHQADFDDNVLIDFAFIEPISIIYEIDKKGVPQYDEGLSQTNRDIVQMAISDYAVSQIRYDDDSLRLDALADFDYTFMQLLDGMPLSIVDIPVNLRTTLMGSEMPYTIGLLSDGFQLSRKRNLREIGLSAMIAMATFGSQIKIPMKNANYLYCVVFDNHDGSLIGFIPIESAYKNPVNPKAIFRQVKTLSRRLKKRKVQRMVVRGYE